ncbi:MAG: hypothetical protein ABFC54_06005, partial [Thermoguttaceae bacterium]
MRFSRELFQYSPDRPKNSQPATNGFARPDALPHNPHVRYNREMNAICLVVDRLHASHLGAYGNAWIETPCLDRLAAQSLVFDRALIDSPRLDRLYRSYWHGLHAMCPAPADDRPSLASLLRTADVHTALLTDDVDVARHPLAADFDELVEIDPPWTSQTAEQMDQTQLARCCVEIIR